MKLLSLLFAVLGSFLKSLFSCSDQERLGRAEERIDEFEKRDEVKKKIEYAGDLAPKTLSEVINRLKSGSVAILFCMSLATITGCAQNLPVACPKPSVWTSAQQDEIAANLSVLPESSPLIPVVIEWTRLRDESKACIEATSGE